MPKLNSSELKMKAKMERDISILEGLTVSGAIRIMRGKDEKRKFALIKDLAGKILGRKVEVKGQGANGEFVIKIERGQPETNGNNLPIARFTVPSLS